MSRFREDHSQASPFADPVNVNDRDAAELRQALRDVVTIRPVDNRPPPRSGTDTSLDAYGGDDILSSYTDRPSPGGSPAKEPSSSVTGAGTRGKERDKGSRSSPPHDKRKELPRRTTSKSTSSSKTSDVPFDVIDRLDISGLYGGGALMRHDGPFAAATASRNKGPRAPMAAFDVSALAPPTSASSRAPRASSNLSARAQVTLAAMDSEGGLNDSPYGAASSGSRPRLGRRASESSITMGFPSGAGSKGKGQQLIEIYGVRESEAWEDFGTRYSANDGGSFASSRESVLPPGVSKEDRIGRAQSIWDIEATLRAGKPVGQAPPPVPVLPLGLNGLQAPEKPKRSKSIAARFRAGRRNPNNPMDDTDDAVDVARANERSAQVPLGVMPDDNGRYADPDEKASDDFDQAGGNVRFAKKPTSPRKDTYGDGPPSALSNSTRSVGPDGQPLSPQLGRRPSVMQRIFAGAKKSSKA